MTALGLDLATSWDNLVAGKSGARKITLFDTSEHTTKFACRAAPVQFDDYAGITARSIYPSRWQGRQKCVLYARKKAVRDSNLDFEKFDKSRCGVIFGLVGTGLFQSGRAERPEKPDHQNHVQCHGGLGIHRI